ncbi:MAG: glycosyltransferase family 2 protein [Chlamydiota bacterium]|nr:glycosyltransferase family 2 protein [Chlamydiota bacterium]
MKLCVVICAYYEEAKIEDVVKGTLPYAEVVVVDDGSTDRTAEIARKAGARVIIHSVNKGKGEAIKTGIAHFLESNCDLLILMDGDGQHLPSDIPGFLAAYRMKKNLMMIGTRMKDTRDMPLIRIWTNRFMSWLLSRSLGVKVTDTQCGFRMIDRVLAQKMHLNSERFDIESELLIQAVRAHAVIQEVAVSTVYADEHSKIRPVRDTIRFIKLLYRSYSGEKDTNITP